MVLAAQANPMGCAQSIVQVSTRIHVCKAKLKRCFFISIEIAMQGITPVRDDNDTLGRKWVQMLSIDVVFGSCAFFGYDLVVVVFFRNTDRSLNAFRCIIVFLGPICMNVL